MLFSHLVRCFCLPGTSPWLVVALNVTLVLLMAALVAVWYLDSQNSTHALVMGCLTLFLGVTVNWVVCKHHDKLFAPADMDAIVGDASGKGREGSKKEA